jgi:hypothetical protein
LLLIPLTFQNKKKKRAAELAVANTEHFQNEKKDAAELAVANELAFQNEEKRKSGS